MVYIPEDRVFHPRGRRICPYVALVVASNRTGPENVRYDWHGLRLFPIGGFSLHLKPGDGRSALSALTERSNFCLQVGLSYS